MCKLFLSVLIIYLLLPNDVLGGHRTSASRQKTLAAAAAAAAAKSKVSTMRNRMKQVLHLRDDNSLTSMFKSMDEDPVYVFVLPDKRNKTVVFHQSDFTKMEYPRISEVGRMDGPVYYKPLNATVFRDAAANKTTPIAQRLTIRDEDEEDDDFSSDYSDDEEAEMNRIIEENVRTERNFIRYMEDLKRRPQKSKKKPSSPPSKAPVNFQHFGDHFHPDLFHSSGDGSSSSLDDVIRPPPPTIQYHSEDEEEDADEDYLEKPRPKKNRPKKVKKKPGYGNIGEVISPPYHEDNIDESGDFVSDQKIVTKLKSARRPVQSANHKESSFETPSNIYESRKHENGGWDDLGLDGWSGGLSDPVHEFEEKVVRPPPSDIFNEGLSYNRMKEMFEKHVGYSYHQIHPPPVSTKSPSLTYYEQEVIPTRDTKPNTSWREGGDGSQSSYNSRPRPVPGLKSPYSDQEDDADDYEVEETEEQVHQGEEVEDYSHNPYEGHEYSEAVQKESNEYIPPRVRSKFKNHPSPFEGDEDESENDVEDSAAEEEFVYMINGKPISWELAQLLQNEHAPLNLTRHVKTPSSSSSSPWQITNSRSMHRDADVFVARANNPFGHSTKWIWSNASASYVIPKKQKNRLSRSKRGVPQLYSMVKCATGCDPIVYKGYGCYCGFLGQGEPLDGIDKCCKLHDTCYSNTRCTPYLEYFVPYLWKCYKGTPLCAVNHGEWGNADSCAARLCQCDLKLSMCLRRYYCPTKRNVCTASPWRLLQNFIMDF